MKFLSKVNGRIPEMLGIPDQTLPGVPIIEIYGDRRVLIEGRSTVVEYSITCIKLKNSCGIVAVCGCGMCIAELSEQQTIIVGKIESVSINRGTK